tara:strand:- start:79 stop:432 length:354 start_codon:yes stop_codon:yes gene_type:complete
MIVELNQKELDKVRKECKKFGIIPIKNAKNEDLRLLELYRLGIMEKNLEQDPRFSSLSEVASYLTECPYCAINILSSTIQRCKIIYGLSKKEKKILILQIKFLALTILLPLLCLLIL